MRGEAAQDSSGEHAYPAEERVGEPGLVPQHRKAVHGGNEVEQQAPRLLAELHHLRGLSHATALLKPPVHVRLRKARLLDALQHMVLFGSHARRLEDRLELLVGHGGLLRRLLHLELAADRDRHEPVNE